MSESFGARMRQRREHQGIALSTIAEQTKIKLSLLESLERDDVSHWPSGIFRRAFIRAYAHAIGLDPDVVVREFLEIYSDPIEVAETAEAIALAADAARSGPPQTRIGQFVGSAIGSLSRLRRSPAIEEPVAAPRIQVSVPAPPEPDPPAVAAPSSEPLPVHTMQVQTTNEVPVHSAPVNEPVPPEPDLLAIAELCTEFGRVENTGQVQPLLQEAARIVDAIGLIVWVWDPQGEEVRAGLAHGYSDKVLAQLPTVRRDADNATAAAFRSAQACAMNGSDHSSGALVVPLLTPGGCAGVLATELQRGSEQTRSVRAVLTILAAQLAQLIGDPLQPMVRPKEDAMIPSDSHAVHPLWNMGR
jgi:transcriptional regulator with XRE-family HTH domain